MLRLLRITISSWKRPKKPPLLEYLDKVPIHARDLIAIFCGGVHVSLHTCHGSDWYGDNIAEAPTWPRAELSANTDSCNIARRAPMPSGT